MVAGLRGSGDWGADERPTNYRETILWMEPEGAAPFFALTARTKKESTNDPQYSWWHEPIDQVRLIVSAIDGGATTGTLITVDSTNPTAANLRQNYGAADQLVPGDILQVEPAADSATYDWEQIIVTQVLSATQFVVQRAANGTAADSIADNIALTRIGNAFAEGSAAPASSLRNPIKFYNYTQIFKTTYSLTGTAVETKLRTGDPLANEKKRKLFDHSHVIEQAMLWGTRFEGTDPITGKIRRTTGGLRTMIPAVNTTILTTNWDIALAGSGNNLLEAISPVFEYASPAGMERIAFCGNGALNRINQALLANGSQSALRMSTGISEKVFGMNFRELSFPQGRILVKSHPLMSRHPKFNYSMFIVDFSAIKYRPMANRDTKFKDNVQADDEDVRRGLWLTEAGIEVGMGGQTCGYIGGFDATFATPA